ncbi:hypothetical protein HY522_10700 [bacterium]|nr:hypothetical protein [bacterium]
MLFPRRFLCALGVCAALSAVTYVAADGSIGVASEKPFRAQTGEDPALAANYERALALLHAGRIHEAAVQFAVVAKLAGEPLRSQALLKFGYAASILERPGAPAALAAAAMTPVGGAEGNEIRSFARKLIRNAEPHELLLAPPRDLPRSRRADGFGRRAGKSAVSLWDEIGRIETFRQKGRLTESVARYQELLRVYPEHPVVLNNLALVMSELEDPSAETLIRRAFLADGADEYVDFLYDTLGLTLLRQGRPVEALEHFRRSMAMRETAERDLHMAMALDQIGQPDVAGQYRARARALDTTGGLDSSPE